MSDTQHSDDPIHEIFAVLRRGLSVFVVNIVDRVERELERYVPDERHASPPFELVVKDSSKELLNIATRLAKEVASHAKERSGESRQSEPALDAPDPAPTADSDGLSDKSERAGTAPETKPTSDEPKLD